VCGRYANVTTTADLAAEFGVQETYAEELPPSWNIAPTDPVQVVLRRPPKGQPTSVTQLRTMRWGLVPSWAKDRKIGARMINARIETVTEKPAFKKAAAARRCLLPAAGYFEWEKAPTGKVPYFLHPADHELVAFAGLYELWRDHELADDDPNRWLWTCTIVTQQASDALGYIHDRSPVIVPTELQESWLDCSADDLEVARRLLEEMPPPHLQPTIVSSAVNSVKNNGPELIVPVAG
jgi:putative SOS response-associated peptidase YedK